LVCLGLLDKGVVLVLSVEYSSARRKDARSKRSPKLRGKDARKQGITDVWMYHTNVVHVVDVVADELELLVYVPEIAHLEDELSE
jgi:hypothetical protein